MEEFYIENDDFFGDNISDIEKKQKEKEERKGKNTYKNNNNINN